MINLDTITINSRPNIFSTTPQLSRANHWDHFLARLGYKRSQHCVEPGLYAIGNPSPDSPVFVTANYTLSFDALRSNLNGIDGYILVLDTNGVNVWCAAGKKTFSTEEIVLRVTATQLKKVVNRHVLILPQLGAPGVAAHEVKKRTGFKVEYGPVRATDLPEYLKTRQATSVMRQVNFPLRDRIILIPVDFVHLILPTVLAALVFYFFLGGLLPALAVLAVLFSAGILFPILLPWLPTHNFSTKGFFLGFLTALPFALSVFIRHPDWTWYHQAGQAFGFLLAMPAVVAFISLNFTGSTTFTSKTGVRREMFAYLPAMAWIFAAGIILNIAFAFIR
ncbi:MAG: carbon monoxide dehydrogenase [Chloroflexi bacterium GWB2_49_20]|nr:MAG: carbon monoxide dehydrogenase [Chloroflexi bacterium GWB2_49_20]OGN79306.1 MAG: carbon monoxide dehydrogenase [Chloroflexi bacterium GWC2_49_37]OGN82924.1 MAG: carbon monoxide dehydrogenase [Chloroflexi bacterium GWD2_49_16]HCC78577.1 carbon monoxide dehydrogenase [Anaerolineae bacterium]